MSDELKRCELEETESYEAARVGWNGELETFTVHVHECTECGIECEQVNGSYKRCPHCGAVNVLDENYEPKSKWQSNGEQMDSRERLEADVRNQAECSWVTAPHWKVIDWLDRQKRITMHEHQEGCEYKAKAEELQERVDSLTAELERKQRVIDITRDSFLKLEAENAELRRALDGASDALDAI